MYKEKTVVGAIGSSPKLSMDNGDGSTGAVTPV
jgi:hypothetical protein